MMKDTSANVHYGTISSLRECVVSSTVMLLCEWVVSFTVISCLSAHHLVTQRIHTMIGLSTTRRIRIMMKYTTHTEYAPDAESHNASAIVHIIY